MIDRSRIKFGDEKHLKAERRRALLPQDATKYLDRRGASNHDNPILEMRIPLLASVGSMSGLLRCVMEAWRA